MHSPDVFDHRARFMERLCNRVSMELGFKIESLPEGMVRSRLARRAKDLDLHLDDYIEMAASGSGFNAERRHLLDALTTNTTAFFREIEHFRQLRGPVLRSILESRSSPTIKVWSAASSNGAEAYSAAMSLQDLRSRHDFRFAVLGTDVSHRMVEAARVGIYGVDDVKDVPASLLERYVHEDRASGGRVRISPEIRGRTRFLAMNLKAPAYPVDDDVDVILLRNVLIYFDEDTRRHVVDRLMSHLRPGGHLMLGHAEANAGSAMGLEACGPSVFKKPLISHHAVKVVAA